MEISKEIKTKIFAQYLGQNVFAKGYGELYLDSIGFGFEWLDNKGYKLCLKPLSSISDEDAIECLRIRERFDNELEFINAKVTSRGKNSVGFTVSYKKYADAQKWLYFDDRTTTAGFQYLQSKGYALPYIEYTVEDLVKAGIYKFI